MIRIVYEMLLVSLASTSRAVLACLSLCLFALPVAFAADATDIAAFREARFGLFIHWGLYSQLGGRWKGRTMDYIGEWIQSRYRIPNAEYAKVADVFNPVLFDADDWARQAKAAGMEYAVFTTKHHDGFSMFETHVSDYNIVDATPFKRDAFGEFAAACRRQGLKVGLYYSQNLDWHEFDAADPEGNAGRNRDDLFNKGMSWGNTWDFPDATNKNLDRYLKTKVYPQLKELLTNYGEIFVIWFDCPNGMSAKQSKDLKDYVKSLQPHVLVSGRIGNGLGDFDTPGDNQLLAGKSDFPLECPITLNDTWGFKYDDHNWKTGYRVACDLMETLSGNANFILNIGPRPDGRFPDASSDVLRELADWRRETGVQIKGAKESPFAQTMPWGWCTVADDNVLQLVVKSDWTNELSVCGIRNEIASCTVPFEKSGETLTLKLSSPDDAMPRVVRIALKGTPDIDTRLMPQSGELVLHPSAALRVVGDKSCRVTNRGALTNAHHPGDEIVWKAYFPKAARYAVWVRTETWAHGRPWAGDRAVEVRIGDAVATAELKKDRPLPHTVYDRADSRIGTLAVPAPGEYEVSVKTVASGDDAQYYDLSALNLEEDR